jgi:hypothetical protein
MSTHLTVWRARRVRRRHAAAGRAAEHRAARGGAAVRRLLARIEDRWQVLIDIDTRATAT